MSQFVCFGCGEKVEFNNLIDHIMDRHPDAYFDALDEVVREYFGEGGITDEPMKEDK